MAQDRAPGIKKLKRERMKRFGVTADELTGRPLHAADAQFAHIVAQSVEPFVSDCVWNGLIVHRHVHAELTLAGVLNHEQLLLHCQQSGYSVAWYEPFCEEYARVKRVG